MILEIQNKVATGRVSHHAVGIGFTAGLMLNSALPTDIIIISEVGLTLFPKLGVIGPVSARVVQLHWFASPLPQWLG